MVAGGCEVAAAVHGGEAQLQRGAAFGRGCAPDGDSDGGQCLPAGAGRPVAGGERGCAGEDGKGIAGPGGGEPRGRDVAVAGRTAGEGGVPDAAAALDCGAEPSGQGPFVAGAHDRTAAG